MKKSKIEKLMSIIPITLAFVLVGVFVLMMVGSLPKSRFMIDTILILLILCFGCISCLTASRILSKEKDKKHHILAYVIIGLTGLTCLLWIIFVFIGQGLLDKAVNDSADITNLVGVWTYTKITIFVTIQTSIANLIVSNIYTFKKDYFPFQIVMYVSNFLVDLWLTIVIMSLNIKDGEMVFNAQWMFDSKFIWTLFSLALAYSILASAVLKSIIKKRTRDLTLDQQTIIKNIKDNNVEIETNSIENRIKKLDDLKEKGIISEEEYAAKKAKILEEI